MRLKSRRNVATLDWLWRLTPGHSDIGMSLRVGAETPRENSKDCVLSPGMEDMCIDTEEEIGKNGIFLTPGKDAEAITLLAGGRVVFRCASGATTAAHGNWSTWETTGSLKVLSLTFHYKGKESVQDLRAHNFYEIVPGLYRTTDEWQLTL